MPFIARYRKEVTGALDDAQLRTLEERLRYLRELEERRAAILESIRAQGKLDDALTARIMAADSKARLEDIYLPYKPKRRTKAQIAREAGLEPLADLLLADPGRGPRSGGRGFVDPERGVPDAAAALDGARAILAERFAEDADLIGELRELMWSRGRLVSRVREGGEEAGAKFADYFEFDEPFTALPSHRILAMMRGEKEEVLELTMDPGEPAATAQRRTRPGSPAGAGIADQGRPADRWLADTVRWAWRTRIAVHLERGPADAAVAAGRGRGRRGVRGQPARPAAGRAGRDPAHDGPGPRVPHRGQGRRAWTAPASRSPPRRSTRTSREAAPVGPSPSPRWPGWPRRTRWS